MPRPIHFEIHSSDPERTQTFYRTLFNWKFSSAGPVEYWLIETGPADQPGINGGLLRRRGAPPADGQAVNAFVCTIDVPSVDATLAQAPAAGGSLAVPRMALPGIGWLAYLKDPDGNILGVMQADPTAK